jgi:aminopeptidase N
MNIIKGTNFTVTTRFFGAFVPNSLRGFYLTTYHDRTTSAARQWAVTQFEPSDARRAFPCFDYPKDKAVYTVTLIVNQNDTALSNEAPATTTVNADGTKTVVFKPTPPMPSYLVALTVGEMEKTSDDTTPGPRGGKLVVSVYTRPGIGHLAREICTFATIAVQFFHDYFNTRTDDISPDSIAYPLSKLDIVAVPDFAAGGMENWGLITIRERFLLAREGGKYAFEDGVDSIVAICHEVAHQWFGNLVTTKTWSDLWLHEGISTFLAYECGQAIGRLNDDPESRDYRMADVMYIDTMQEALEADSYKASRPILLPAVTADEANAQFDTITYNKGASIVNMLRQVTETQRRDSFRSGLAAYLKKFRFASANTDDLFVTMTDNLGTSFQIGEVMRSWLRQPNYPVISIRNTTDMGKDSFFLVASQKRFLSALPGDNPPEAWNIQLVGVTEKKAAPFDTIFARSESDQIKVEGNAPSAWVKVNFNETSFYRATYPPHVWSAFAKEFSSSFTPLTSVDLAAILDDAVALTYSTGPERVNISVALNLMRGLYRSSRYAPWATAVKRLREMRFLLAGATGNETVINECRNSFASWQDLLVKDVMGTEFSYTPTTVAKSGNDKLLRSTVLMFASDLAVLPPKLDQAKTLFKEAADKGSLSNIDPNARRAVLHAVVRSDTTDASWKTVVAYMLDRTKFDPQVQHDALVALASTRVPSAINETLYMTLDPSKIRKQDVVTLLSALLDNSAAWKQTLDFIRENFGRLHKDHPSSSSLAGLAFKVSQAIPESSDSLATYTALFKNLAYNDQPSTALKRALAMGQERIAAAATWRGQNFKEMCAWLASSASSPVPPAA